jgi:hypothetical protein
VLIGVGPGADRSAKLLIYLAVEGALLDACSHIIIHGLRDRREQKLYHAAVAGLDPDRGRHEIDTGSVEVLQNGAAHRKPHGNPLIGEAINACRDEASGTNDQAALARKLKTILMVRPNRTTK